MWGFNEDIALGLKLFTGELNPESYHVLVGERELRDKRRMFLDELPEDIRAKILSFFEVDRIIVVSDILKGRGGLSADWILVTRYDKQDGITTWIFKDINTAMNFFGGGEVRISPRGSLYIGRITMQRKGGTPDPTKLQFKIKPCELLKLDGKHGS
ncbi:MAG: R.HinP1I restriction endonuclease [Candidatus Syntrophoarchaeum sp. GoM_oil]|nr:MAG: R.HinP1I restriction endonuclease [Candidatus Syntrophoarchaeum sp. GoM_oil]